MDSKQWYTCDKCGKKLSSYKSLWRHKKNCKTSQSTSNWSVTETPHINEFRSTLGQKRPRSPNFNGADKETGPRNPKITALLDEIMNDNSPDRDMDVASQKSLPPSIAVKQKSSPTISRPSPQKTLLTVFPSTKSIVPPQPSAEVIAKVFPSMTEKELPTPPPPPHAVNEVFPQAAESSPRTKEDIIGFSGDESDEDEEEHEHSDIESDQSIDIADINPKVKFLPATVDGLVERFSELFKEFIREGKHEHRNELVFLLDELLRQEGIDLDQYNQLNTMLAESLDEEDDDVKEEEEMAVDAEDEDDEVKKVIQTTFHDIIQHDEEELMELLAELKDEADDDYIDTLLKVEELIDVFLTDEFLEGKPILSTIDELIETLDGYPISKSKQHRLKMLMNDINSNRHRVQSIFTRLDGA